MRTDAGLVAGPSVFPDDPDLRCGPLTAHLAAQIVERTLDPADATLRAMTHDLDRFSSLEQLDAWRARGRTVLCLHDDRETLQGVFWIAEKPLPERDDYCDPMVFGALQPRFTMAIRMYGEARGRGIAKAFMRYAFEELLPGLPGRRSLWFETKSANIVTRNLGKRAGFVEVTSDAGGTVVGVRFAD